MHILLTKIDGSPQPLRVTTPELGHANPSLPTHILECSAIAENCYQAIQPYHCAAFLLRSNCLSVTLALSAPALLPPTSPKP